MVKRSCYQLIIDGNIAGMDYMKFRKEALERRRDLTSRLNEIVEERIILQAEMESKQRELAAVDRILEGLDSVNSDEPLEGEPSGMADHIRRLLQQSPVHLLPTQIRDALINVGITGSSPKNLLIGVHNVLSRLQLFLETAEVNNRAAYRWKRETNKAAKETISANEKILASVNSQVARMRKHK